MPDPADPTPPARDDAYYAGLSQSIAAGDYTVAGPVEPGPRHRGIREHEVVELIRGVPGFPAGTIGTVVGVYTGSTPGYEVEFTSAGRTVAVVTVGATDIRPVDRG